MGKYMNDYTTTEFGYIPPGWDVWRAFSTSGSVPYFDYALDVDGTAVQYGSTAADYSTDVLAREADAFIRGTPPDQRLFLWFAPSAPHTPRTPAPRYASDPRCTARPIPPSQGEADVADKPTWVQRLTWDPTISTNTARNGWIKSCRALLAVDDAVATILGAADRTAGRAGRPGLLSHRGSSARHRRWSQSGTGHGRANEGEEASG
jgi:hypothetical protein